MSNLYKRLAALFPQDPLFTGVVLSTDGFQTVLSVFGSGSITVRGTAEVGQTVYYRGGVIEGVAVAMTGGDIEV